MNCIACQNGSKRLSLGLLFSMDPRCQVDLLFHILTRPRLDTSKRIRLLLTLSSRKMERSVVTRTYRYLKLLKIRLIYKALLCEIMRRSFLSYEFTPICSFCRYLKMSAQHLYIVRYAWKCN